MRLHLLNKSQWLKSIIANKWVAATLGAVLVSAPVQAQVVINEVLVDNQETLFPDPADNDYTPAYVELYNTSATPIDLGANFSWSLSDSLTNPRKFIFPANTVIPGHDYLLLFLDNDINRPGLHVGFGLKENGDDVTLYDALGNGGQQKDRLYYGMQLVDRALSRTVDGTGAFALLRPTPGEANNGAPIVPTMASTNLWINEWSSDGSPDWFEIYNPESAVVDLAGISFRDNVVPAAPRKLPVFSFIDAGGFLQFLADDLDNGDKTNEWERVDFKLSKSGDQIWMLSSNMVAIDMVTTLALNGSQTGGRLPDGSTNILHPLGIATPEMSNLQLITNLVFNEVLAHTDLPYEDAVEFYNPTPVEVNIGNWLLSNSKDNAQKYQIPANTMVPAHGYKVFYEYRQDSSVPKKGFNTSDTGKSPDFTLNSARGDEVYLYSADAAGTLLGGRLGQTFSTSENGVSFGRHTNSQGKVEFVAQSRPSFGSNNPGTILAFRAGTGLVNAGPKQGPLVVSEIMYQPPDVLIGGVMTNNSWDEYIEVYNATTTNVALHDANGYYFEPSVPPWNVIPYADGRTNTWRLRGEVDLDFPMGLVLGPGQYLLIVSFASSNTAQMAAFRTKYNVPAGVPIIGPYQGKLSNSSGSIEFQKPDAPQGPLHPGDFAERLVPYILAEKVNYSENTPWPTNAVSGGGKALQRLQPESYGNDPINWTAADPNPGRHPSLSISHVAKQGDQLIIGFQGMAYGTYSLQYQTNLNDTGAWKVANQLPIQTTTGMRYVTNSGLSAISQRFFRVVTPAQP